MSKRKVKRPEPIEPRPAAIEMMDPFRGGDQLTRMQFLFIERFFECDCDPKLAAIAAGYSEENAAHQAELLMTHPIIQKELTARLQAWRNGQAIHLDKVVEGLLHEATFNGKGASHMARVAAWGNIARILGGFDKDSSYGRGSKKTIAVVNMDMGPKPKLIEGKVIDGSASDDHAK